ncbi:MAG: hypothetical protein JWM93_731 [Frankiales bacterium]|nr:hypothetical protein [Frankiales bacterium]
MWSQTTRALISISGTITTSVNVIDAATDSAKVSVRTGLVLTYCADRLSIESHAQAWRDATAAARILPDVAEQFEPRGFEHDMSVLVDVRGQQPRNFRGIPSGAAQTGRAHVVVTVGGTDMYVYDLAAFDSCVAAWTSAAALGALAFPAESIDAFDDVIRRADAKERRKLDRKHQRI